MNSGAALIHALDGWRSRSIVLVRASYPKCGHVSEEWCAWEGIRLAVVLGSALLDIVKSPYAPGKLQAILDSRSRTGRAVARSARTTPLVPPSLRGPAAWIFWKKAAATTAVTSGSAHVQELDGEGTR